MRSLLVARRPRHGWPLRTRMASIPGGAWSLGLKLYPYRQGCRGVWVFVVRRVDLEVASVEIPFGLVDERARKGAADALQNAQMIMVRPPASVTAWGGLVARLAVVFGHDVEPIAISPDAVFEPAGGSAIIGLVDAELMVASARLAGPGSST